MKSRYALMALTRLAKEYGNGPVFIAEIAREEKIPRRFLENILQELKNVGFVKSRLGKNGGYLLSGPPQNISLLSIVQFTEGSIGLIDCVSEVSPSNCIFCKDIPQCKVHAIFSEIRDFTINRLGKTTLADLLNEQ